MRISFQHERPGLVELLHLYRSVGWTAYTAEPHRLEKAVAGSQWVRTARANEQLVGLCRAVTDGASICYLQDVLVDPAFHRRGIGRALVQACLDEHREVRQLVLLTDGRPQQIAFYEALGLKNTRTLQKVELNAFVRFVGLDLE